MIRSFLKDTRGNFAILTAIAMVPIMGALTLAIDYSEMSRRRQMMINALDAAGIATARELISGASDAELKTYATNFFESNLSKAIQPADTTLTVLLPQNNSGGATLKLCSTLVYHPYFLPVFRVLLRQPLEEISFDACTDIQLQNTLEVALVLDNSGSMDERGPGATGTRMELLREAAGELVETFASRAQSMRQIEAPVQFSLVPFAASVNIGRNNALNSDGTPKSWMDKDGISPIHHENFNWNSFPNANRKVTKGTDGIYYKKGTAWGTQQNQKVTRFTLFDEMKYFNNYGQKLKYTSWQGCAEARPYPLNIEDDTPNSSDPTTLFVPMFAPDETDQRDSSNRTAYNNWWRDVSTSSSTVTRQTYMPKYFDIASIGHVAPNGTNPAGLNQGPNSSCSTTPITPLADLSVESEKTALLTAIENMSALGATNVPEGLAWGWRTLSSGEPFTTGRPSTDRGNDKVVIVLTDGANTYYTPEWLGKPDLAGNKSTYSAFGYARMILDPANLIGRIFQGAPSSINKTDYSNPNYTKAMNYLFDDGEEYDKDGGNAETLCNNVREDNTMIITVSLDLDSTKPDQKAQMDALKNCASTSKYDDEKILYYNATSKNLKEIFEEIAKELSNLRIVG